MNTQTEDAPANPFVSPANLLLHTQFIRALPESLVQFAGHFMQAAFVLFSSGVYRTFTSEDILYLTRPVRDSLPADITLQLFELWTDFLVQHSRLTKIPGMDHAIYILN